VLLLAAGKSRRFGGDKRRAIIEARETLLEKSLQVYRGAGYPVLLCLSARLQDDALEERVTAAGVSVLRAQNAENGMGATLAEAVGSVGGVSALIIALADMPGILPDTLALLESHLGTDRIVYPVYKGQRGHPVIFGSAFFPLLQQQSGDRGASGIIDQNQACCFPVDVEDPGVLMDIDTPLDIKRLNDLLQRRGSAGASI
jgi:molybdenum cofactor cytidylyltransferase